MGESFGYVFACCLVWFCFMYYILNKMDERLDNLQEQQTEMSKQVDSLPVNHEPIKYVPTDFEKCLANIKAGQTYELKAAFWGSNPFNSPLPDGTKMKILEVRDTWYRGDVGYGTKNGLCDTNVAKLIEEK